MSSNPSQRRPGRPLLPCGASILKPPTLSTADAGSLTRANLQRWVSLTTGYTGPRHGIDGALQMEPTKKKNWARPIQTEELVGTGHTCYASDNELRPFPSLTTLKQYEEKATISRGQQIAGISAGPLSDALETEHYTLVLGTFSLPINIPETNYKKGLQARRKLVAMFTDRRSSGCNDDILNAILSGNEGTREKLSDVRIIDLLITLIYSGYETVSMTMMMAVKYLKS
ncbi:hypothetical protein EJB05_25698, partial [Eragrostis curvula]